jgi:hypothetical protein
MSQFQRDDEWQEEQRARLLAPIYERIFRAGLIKAYRKSKKEVGPEQTRGDTLVWRHSGDVIGIEEKIVRPRHRNPHDPYTALTLETESCVVEGYERNGWMWTGDYDLLLYVHCALGEAARGYLFNFQRLRSWFVRHVEEFPATFTEQRNRSRCRVVPLQAMRDGDVHFDSLIWPGENDAVLAERITSAPRRLAEYICEAYSCGKVAAFGFGDRHFCFAHLPRKQVEEHRRRGEPEPTTPHVDVGQRNQTLASQRKKEQGDDYGSLFDARLPIRNAATDEGEAGGGISEDHAHEPDRRR